MGFYGNITNINKTTFQFDKIYPNRKEMDDACAGDGVFIGRYVLVDYNEDSILGYVHAQITDENLKNKPVVVGYQEKREDENGNVEILADRFYSGIPEVTEDGTAIKTDRLYKIGEETSGSTIAPDTLLLSLGYISTKVEIKREGGTEEEPIESIHYIINGIENNNFNPQIFVARAPAEEGESADFLLLRDIDSIWDWNKGRFFINHQIDATSYGESNIGRGWDSTVWQKVYKDGTPSYVMVAELNSVVPTFDVVSDAPTVIPQKPYYDADSSNVYYRLHMQPSWGLRVKADEDKDYSDGVVLPSDVKGPYEKRYNYTEDEDLAIYWFKDGFNKYIESVSEYNEDIVKMSPTGKSGNTYYENGTFGQEKIDTYELSIMLPSIGQAVSNLWDIVYGKGTYTDILGNTLWDKSRTDYDFVYSKKPVEGDEDSEDIKIRNTALEWNTRNGARAYWEYDSEEERKITYNKEALNTLAGTINSAHDLMGMIIIENDNLLSSDSSLKAKNADPSNIYYDKTTKKYYRKGKKYLFSGSAPIGISGSNMFNPADGNHYKLESYAYDNYDNIYAEDKESDTPKYEQVINNYYKVNNTDTLFENEVYGTLTSSKINNFSPKNYDPSGEEETDFLWWRCTDHALPHYVHEVAETPAHGSYYKITAELTAERPTFYTPKVYYLMKNSELTTVQEREDWENPDKTNFKQADFNYLGIMNDATLTLALVNNGINLNDENRTVGYRILKGVSVDPSRSDYILVDINRRKNEETLTTDPNITQNEDGAFVYQWNNLEATLQSVDTIVEEVTVEDEVQYIEKYQYDITVFRSPSHTALGSKTLKEWKEYIENPDNHVTIENFSDLIPDMNFERRITDPFYTLDRATDVTKIIKDLVQENGIATTGYYFLYDETAAVREDIHDDNGQRYYEPIINPNSTQAESSSWYKLTITPVPVYYSLDGQHYIKNDDNFLRETASILFLEELEEGEKPSYYTVSFTPETKTPFVPGLYYTKTGNEYTVANTFDSSKTYYRYIDRYVSADSSGIYDVGAKWNEDIVPVPSTVTVSGKKFEWEFQEIPNFAKDVNTLHGLILKVNEVLLSDDKVTRDNNTVQGCINLINDILDKFDQLKPAEIVMVDTYGRIHSGDWSSEQKFGYSNIGKPSADLAVPTGDPVAADNERWLKLTTSSGISNNGYKPHIKLEHTFNKVEDTTTVADKNNTNGDGLNKGNNDELKLYTPIVDNTGHVVGNNIETVTLPYNFKTVNADTGSIIAENTLDNFGIKTADNWLSTSVNNKNVLIAHDNPQIVEARTIENQKLHFGNSFTVEDWSFDAKGHKSRVDTHTVTIPNLTISGNGNLIANAATNADGDLTLTKNNVGALALTGYSAISNEVIPQAPTAETTVNNAIANIMRYLGNGSLSAEVEDGNEVVTGINLTNGAITLESTQLGTAAWQDSTAFDAAGTAAQAKADVLGDAATATASDNTLAGLRKYIVQEFNNVTNTGSFWGAQFKYDNSAYSSTNQQEIQMQTQNDRRALVPLSNSDVITYGSFAQDSYIVNTNGGIAITYAGLYRVQGSIAASFGSGVYSVKTWIMKSNDNYENPAVISSATESLDEDSLSGGVFCTGSKLVQLQAGDVVYLACTITPGQAGGGGGSSTTTTATILYDNPGTYFLLERISA